MEDGALMGGSRADQGHGLEGLRWRLDTACPPALAAPPRAPGHWMQALGNQRPEYS